ncbi:GGDEF domain-containing protein [Sphingomonas abaci]|uniref:diguanylate cyclase n=1 Tax=Sphingomonas abaci TaxID=237611 RepID=A0A7W7EYX8_9SPHN|nr:GGDEF domain-containing protein [Sphingomonas abaci]MBB4616820.1 diguanylate cyclase (GGDEF)-like protein [Sphingomonas abaci]
MPLTLHPPVVDPPVITEALRQIEAEGLWEEVNGRCTGVIRRAPLSPALARIVRLVTWSENRRIALGWFRNVTIILWLTMPFDYIVAPRALPAIVLGHGLLTTIAYLLARRAWQEIGHERWQGLTACLFTAIVMLAAVVTGSQLGGQDFERLMNIAFFGLAVGLVLLPLSLRWTAWTAVVLNAAFLASQYLNPAVTTASGLLYTLYFGFLSMAMLYTRMHMIRRQVRATLSRLSETRYRHMLVQAYDRLRWMATTDSLTGLRNRPAMSDAFTRLVREMPADAPLSVAMIDIDDFKRLNDSLGHAAGDQALQAMGTLLQDLAVAHGAICGRIGGEEFLVLLPGTAQAAARERITTLMQALAARAIPNPGSRIATHVTLSAGIVSTSEAGGHGLETLMRAADQALYAAKRAGRNRIMSADLPPFAIMV